MRKAVIQRSTRETQIKLELNLDGNGVAKVDSGIGFFDHMMQLLAVHSNMDITLACQGDLLVDTHHTVEDIGIALGQAFSQAIGDKKGIARYADIALPMDEVLANVAMDISGRPFLVFNAQLYGRCGDFENQMVVEFFRAFAINAGITLHVNVQYGSNQHHIIEGIFKGVARCLARAVSVVSDKIPSSKGVL